MPVVSGVRVLAGRVALVLAALLLPLGMVSSWTSAVLTETHRYVDTVAPLASDPVVKEAAVKLLSREALKMVEVSSTSPQLGAILDRLGVTDAVRPQLELVVETVVTGIVEGPFFATAWTEANRSAHEQLVDILEGRRGVVLDGNGRVSIELGTVLNSIAASLGNQGLINTAGGLPTVNTSFAIVKADDLDNARLGYELLNTLGFWLPVAWLVAVVALLLLNPRRWRALWMLGTVSAVGMIALVLLLAWARSALAGSAGDQEVTRVIFDVVTGSLRTSAVVGMVVAGVTAAGAAWMSGRSA